MLAFITVVSITVSDIPVCERIYNGVLVQHDGLEAFRFRRGGLGSYERNRPQMDVSPDGRWLLVADLGGYKGSEKVGPSIALVDLTTGKLVAKKRAIATKAFFLADSSRVILSSEQNGRSVGQVFMIPDFMPYAHPVDRGEILALSHDRRLVACAGRKAPGGRTGLESLTVWDSKTNSDVKTIRSEFVRLDRGAEFSRDGTLLVVPAMHDYQETRKGGRDWCPGVLVYDMSTGKPVHALVHESTVAGVGGSLVREPGNEVRAIALSPDNTHLLAYGGGIDESPVWKWTLAREKVFIETKDARNRVVDKIVYDRMGSRVFIGGDDWGLFWSVEATCPVRILDDKRADGWPTSRIVRYVGNSDGSRVFMLTADGTVHVWKMRLGNR